MTDEQLWPLRPESGPREELISRHLPMARRVATRYRNPHEPQEDLDQVAGLALIGAVDRFDHARGIPFPAFAVPTILGEVKRHFRGTAWALHVPRAAAERAQAAQRAEESLTDRLGRTPTVAELGDFLQFDLETTVEALGARAARYAVSLDAPLDEGEDAIDLTQMLGDIDDGYDLVDARATLAGAIRGLPFLERRALLLRAEQNLSQKEIGKRLGCSQMQVSRILTRATRQLSSQLQGADADAPPLSVA